MRGRARGVIPLAQRRVAEDCEPGDEVTFTGPPYCQRGLKTIIAPAAAGRVCCILGGSALVRFAGGTLELLVLPGQRVTVLSTFRPR